MTILQNLKSNLLAHNWQTLNLRAFFFSLMLFLCFSPFLSEFTFFFEHFFYPRIFRVFFLFTSARMGMSKENVKNNLRVNSTTTTKRRKEAKTEEKEYLLEDKISTLMYLLTHMHSIHIFNSIHNSPTLSPLLHPLLCLSIQNFSVMISWPWCYLLYVHITHVF